MIEINENININENELEFQFVRGGGPGGQNVNKLATKVILYFSIYNSQSLTDKQKAVLKKKLRTRLTTEGVLQLSSHRYRTQLANREDVTARFIELLRRAFRKKAKRIKTAVPKTVKERRLEEKKKQSTKKSLRSKKISWD